MSGNKSTQIRIFVSYNINISRMDIYDYIKSKGTLKAELIAIRELIAEMKKTLLKGITRGYVQEYQVNDGQSIVRTEYRNVAELQRAIVMLQTEEYELQNKLIGRGFKLRDGGTL